MRTDYHIHTSFSLDSEYPMEEAVKRAVSIGLQEICFTEHLDYFENGQHHLVDYDGFFPEIKRLQEKYRDAIVLKAGAEFGVQISQTDRFLEVFSHYPFDFVLLSNHQINDLEFWNGNYQRGKDQKQYNREYYEAILEVIKKYKNYSVLAHLDMIKRYDPAGILEDRENEAVIKDILKTVIEDGKGIEINTSSRRYKLSDLTPSRTILSWYLELGGRILTIGSDTHAEGSLGFGTEEVKEELKKLGAKEFCTFQNMEPVFHLL